MMRNLQVLTVTALFAAVPALASAAPPETTADKKLSEHFDSSKKPNTSKIPAHRASDINLQPKNPVGLKPKLLVQGQGFDNKAEHFFIEGTLEQIEDGGLHIGFDVHKAVEGAGIRNMQKQRVLRWYHLANMKATPMSLLRDKVGQKVRLEMTKDAKGVPFVIKILPSR